MRVLDKWNTDVLLTGGIALQLGFMPNSSEVCPVTTSYSDYLHHAPTTNQVAGVLKSITDRARAVSVTLDEGIPSQELEPVYLDPEEKADMDSRIRLSSILHRGVQNGQIAPSTFEVANELLASLHKTVTGRLRTPFIDFMSGGRVLFTWNDSPHMTDAEILPDGTVEFFYNNGETNESEEYIVQPGAMLTGEIAQLLTRHRIAK